MLLLASCGTSGGAASGGVEVTNTSSAVAAATNAGSTAALISASPSSAASTTAGSATTAASSSAGASAPAGTAAQAGRALFVSNGCSACHGDQAQGNIGPPIAGTGLTFAEVLHQVRQPKGQMPPFSPQQVSDAQVQQIYAYLESLGPPTPTPAPTAATPAVASGSASAAPAPVTINVDTIAAAVNDLKVASDYAHDAAKTPTDVKTYGGQAVTALNAAQNAVKAARATGGGNAELQGDLGRLQPLLDALAPDVQAAAAAPTVVAAEPHTNKMVLASRLDLLPLALELVRVNGEVGAVTGTIKDTAGKPVPQALVTIEGGKTHTGLLTDAEGVFKAGDIAAFRSIEVKAYKAGYLYVESHALVTKGGTANVVITIPQESNPPASPQVSNPAVPAGAVGGTATAHFSMTATQKDNNIAPDQLWALSPQAGVAYVLRSTGANTYALDQPLPGLKAGNYTWYFFATTHDCDMSNVGQQTMTVQ
jgi:mono/diheme cytochrome c family protein